MFFAALMSRSCRVRQDGHVQCLVFKLRSASRYPHELQVFELGYQRSITISRRPYFAVLYSSWRRNSPQPTSRMALFSPAFAAAPLGRYFPGRAGSGFGLGRRVMFAAARSSTAITSWSRTSRAGGYGQARC